MRRSVLVLCLLGLSAACAGAAAAQASAPASPIRYDGGDGLTLRKSIVIAGARDVGEGIAAEEEWIRIHYPGATVESRGRVVGPPHYDVVTLKLANGPRLDLHFDITSFFVESEGER